MTTKEALDDIVTSGINLGAGDFVSLEALEVAASVLEKMQWISVKDRLPSNETEVLAVCVRNGFQFICPAIYEDGTPITGYEREWGWRCSRCKHELPDDYDDPDYRPMLDYCPYCGAKMDGGSTNEPV